MVGAGALGGYFGGRLLAAGRDITFLVRPGRMQQLAATGLQVRSSRGDLSLPDPPTVLAEDLHGAYDLIILGPKAKDLAGAIDSFAPAVGSETAILPLMNGMAQFTVLDQRFGPERVLGGTSIISATLAPDGTAVHLNDQDRLFFGDRFHASTPAVERIAATFAGCNFDAVPRANIVLDLWSKWVTINTAAGITTLLRCSVGDLVNAGATGLVQQLLDEAASIAEAAGFRPPDQSLQATVATLTRPGSPFTASMFRDMQNNLPTEADHITGDLLAHGHRLGVETPLLEVAYANMRCYEARLARESAVI